MREYTESYKIADMKGAFVRGNINMIFARNMYIKIAVIIGLTFLLTTAIIYSSINNTFNNVVNNFMTY